MVFKDRVAKYPGRWTMKKSDGSSEVVTLVRNDEPTVEGTPMNAETLNTLSDVAGADIARQQAEQFAEQAKADREQAQAAASAAASNVTALLKGYTDSALASKEAAAASQTAAKTSETESAKNLQGTREYYEQVRTITIGAQGWYATPEALKAAIPVGENGWWAVVGTTDTIWTWDSDTGEWKDSIQKADMSDYYTRAQTDQKFTDLRTEVDTKLKAQKLSKESIEAALGYSIEDKLKRLERMMDMTGKLVYSGTGQIDRYNVKVTLPSTVDYIEITEVGNDYREYSSSGYGAGVAVTPEYGTYKVVRGGSTRMCSRVNGTSYFTVSFSQEGVVEIENRSNQWYFNILGYQYV